MKKLYDTYDEYTPEMDFNKDSEVEVLLMLQKQLRITEQKGLELVLGAANWVTPASSVAISPIYADKITPYHSHEFYESNYVIEGKVACYVDGNPYILEKGDLLIMNPNVRHISYPVGKKVLAKNFILYKSFIEDTAELLAAGDPKNYLSRLISKNMYQIFRGVDKFGVSDAILELNELTSGRGNTGFTVANAKNLAESILITLAECENNDYTADAPVATSPEEEKYKPILKYISEHYSDTSLEKVAKHFGYSTQQIRRIIKKNTGKSYVDYVKSCKMGKIQSMLSKTNIPISEIAETVGYDSPEYFSRRFKYETGYTPTEYRKLRQSNSRTKWEIDNEK